jgi:hypothetical protein
MKEYVEFKVKNRVRKFVTTGFKIFFGILAGIAFALLFGYGIMWLWNWLMPELFGLSHIGYWQAVGILVLARVLFSGLGSGHSSSSRKRKMHTRWQSKCASGVQNDLSKWKHYEKFWEDEGEQAYNAYMERVEKKDS